MVPKALTSARAGRRPDQNKSLDSSSINAAWNLLDPPVREPRPQRVREVTAEELTTWPRSWPGKSMGRVLDRHHVRAIEQGVIFGRILVPSGPSGGPDRSHRAYIHRPLGDLPRLVVAGQRLNTDPLPVALQSMLLEWHARGLRFESP